MPSPTFEASIRRTLDRLRHEIGDEIVRLRTDAGLTRLAVARAAGVDDSYLAKVEDGVVQASHETLARVGLVLGADLRTHLYPNTGPLIRDRWQATILELLLTTHHERWAAYTEVRVLRPSRGWIDLVLHEAREELAVATEIQSALHRIEQLVRWSTDKASALPSWTDWDRLGDPRTSQLLVVRRTRATVSVAREFARQLRVAYPAHPDDAVAALTGTMPWPGPALVWVTVEGAAARFGQGR